MNMYAIGDIHGMPAKLEALMNRIQPSREELLIFLGDYIDRGRNSKAVIDFILRMRAEGYSMVTLRGNHEQMLLDYLDGRDPFGFHRMNGGMATLRSYGLEYGEKNLPEEHLEFLRGLPFYHRTDRYFFTHAGVRPGDDLSQPSPEDCLWIREPFLSSDHDWGRKIIFGHTPRLPPIIQPNKIGIDTGAVFGGLLTALSLPDERFISV